MVKQHLELLGKKAEDKVTGFKGVIDNVSFDLYGCVQATIKPPVDEKGEDKNSQWFDVSRLKLSDEARAMEPPDFFAGEDDVQKRIPNGEKGASEKPSFDSSRG